ncbi:hypothetical protein [Archaeoglobus veneficus]|uniref:Uncharacterized protein n=1 Tax=Archaeoglobus veneficus (strain DSM 11195 / SNP6) TaxID=693661 RepID=F2KRA7_ARCVS|nr:hypothetical protein [Archaeoglobus veneficus]AEA47841.1 hypothetical protein Arcve_1846 [Archaeoglobus veneficus SNP6]
MLSEMEELVLKVVMLGEKRVDKIAKKCGISTILAEKIIERLIEKGYIDYELNPLEKAYRELKWVDWKHGFSYYGEDTKKLVRFIADLAVVIAAIIFISTLMHFFGIIR